MDDRPSQLDWAVGCVIFLVGMLIGFLLALLVVYFAVRWVSNYDDSPVPTQAWAEDVRADGLDLAGCRCTLPPTSLLEVHTKMLYSEIRIGDVLMTHHKYDDEHTAVRRSVHGKIRGELYLKEIHAGRDTEVKPLPYDDFDRLELIVRKAPV